MFHTAIVPNYYFLNYKLSNAIPFHKLLLLEEKNNFFFWSEIYCYSLSIILYVNLILKISLLFLRQIVFFYSNFFFIIHYFLPLMMIFTTIFFSEIVLCICFNWMNFRVYTYYKICYQQRAILNFIVAPSLVVYILL